MFCSTAHRSISFRTWFFQMFFNKRLIKCDKFISCLMQQLNKYWKWVETYKLILHSYWTEQFQNFAIPPAWLSSHSITQKYCYPWIPAKIFQARLFRRFTSPHPKFHFSCTSTHQPPHPVLPKKLWIFQWTPIILTFFIINPIPSFKSN